MFNVWRLIGNAKRVYGHNFTTLGFTTVISITNIFYGCYTEPNRFWLVISHNWMITKARKPSLLNVVGVRKDEFLPFLIVQEWTPFSRLGFNLMRRFQFSSPLQTYQRLIFLFLPRPPILLCSPEISVVYYWFKLKLPFLFPFSLKRLRGL